MDIHKLATGLFLIIARIVLSNAAIGDGLALTTHLAVLSTPYSVLGTQYSILDSDNPLATVDFETEVIPVLTKAGCNSGACHGGAIGRGGFKLSLLGYDPQADYESMLGEFEGRRVNLAHPERSLVLKKPAVEIPHEGGLKLPLGGDGHQVLSDWIAAGAPRGPARRLVKLEVTPDSMWLAESGENFSIQVTAHFSDLSSAPHSSAIEDVTRWAVFTPTDTAALQVTPCGEVTALRPGQSSIMVRFLGEVGSVTIMVPLGEKTAVFEARPRANFIDDHVNRTLDQLYLPHSPRADDTTFVRRAYLDLIGALPDSNEVDALMADAAADKRSRLVDRLMERPEFVDFWSYKWGDLLRIESKRLQPEGAAAFHRWVRECVSHNMPLDEMAREMLLSLGDSHSVGPANFSRVPADARSHAEYVSRVFLGVRLECANCHNHPLDHWTQNDYHGLAAVFARIDRGREVRLLPRGEVIHPKTGQPAVPRIPGCEVLVGYASAYRASANGLAGNDDMLKHNLQDGANLQPCERLAEWLTARDNPFFARAAVNRVWRELMGRGLVEPIDDHRATNPATHPELLDALARDFVENSFDTRHVIRTITASEAYQRSSLSLPENRADDRFYSKAIVRPLPPQVLVDAVAKVTGVPEKLGELPSGTTAVSLGDSRVSSVPLDLLGRCSRDIDCTPAPAASGSLPLTLHTINGAWLNDKIAYPSGRLMRLIEHNQTDNLLVTEFYRVALSRRPTPEELTCWAARLKSTGAEEHAAVLQDFLWGLLNSAEFCCNR